MSKPPKAPNIVAHDRVRKVAPEQRLPCIHTPPPPPNQIIYVTLDRPGVIRGIHRPLWIEGVLSTQRNETDLGSAAYSLHLSKVELYEG